MDPTHDEQTRDDEKQFSYLDAVMIFSQFIGLCLLSFTLDRYDKRLLMSVVCLCLMVSYSLCALFKFASIDSLAYLYCIQVISGFSESLIFPLLISILAEWFTRRNRGLILGIYMTSINIGYILALEMRDLLYEEINKDWPWQWIIISNSFLMGVMAFVNFIWLKPDPIHSGYVIDEFNDRDKKLIKLLRKVKNQQRHQSIKPGSKELSPSDEFNYYYRVQTESNYNSEVNTNDTKTKFTIYKTLKMKEVMIYSIVLCVSKMGSIALFYYLPSFFNQIQANASGVGYITFLNIGAIIGNIVMGYLTDVIYSRKSPMIFTSIFLATVINVIIYVNFSGFKEMVYIFLMIILGFLVNGFSNMIYANCSADIGKELDLKYSQKILSKVCCIIEAAGCLGSSIGLLIIGYTRDADVWGYGDGFWLLITITIGISMFPLFFILGGEIKDIQIIRKNRRKLI